MKYLPWIILAAVVGWVAYKLIQEREQAAAAAAANSSGSLLCQGAAAVATKGLSMTSSVTGNLCNQLAPIITPVVNEAKAVTSTIKNEIKTATKGVQTWEYLATPVAATHIAVNEVDNAYNKVSSWF